jgi:hypothetical protein
MFSRSKKDEPVVIPGLPEDYAAVVARLRGRKPDSDDRLLLAGGETPASVLAVSTALAAKPPEPEKPAFDPSKLEIGQVVEGKGVYVGKHEITSKGGLKKIFDLNAAPEDLTDANDKKLVATYNDSVRTLNKKKGWHGYNGECFENHKELEEALASDTYQGGWFIPAREVVKTHLYQNKDKGDLKGTFTDKRGSDHARWYWSCTEHREHASHVFGVAFTYGDDVWDPKDHFELSTRPVRAELRP